MKIVVIASHPGSLVVFRGEMLRAMVARGHEVLAIAPELDTYIGERLDDMGVRHKAVSMSRAGLNPLTDLRTAIALVRLIREAEPDVTLAYTAKPVIYGTIAAAVARVPLRAAMISGRGSALAGAPGFKRRLLARVMSTMYAVALRGAHVVFFQNPDDEALFRSLGLVGRGQNRVRINGSGVDLDHYAVAPLPSAPLTFLMVGRLIRDKGVFEFVEAARTVKATGVTARFQILGSLDPNPSSISEAQLEQLQEEGIVEHLGTTRDVRPVMAAAHVIVLPSYHEGMPRSVLEGMSMGRPIITTDAPGCRETVEPGRNGVIVPVHDAEALADAMRGFIDQPGLVAEMGRQSRQLAEHRFDVREVNGVILEALAL